ncbi:hypothetical protein [Globicatella sulfidifaciens]|uniref:Uncharacterized protein n=1 Tax=Globicatella sulfidifaciens TaxID=136093 RepID=A0A7X8C5X2_9LACT|nr:hypothetical protein [Globicatella sulfidifaciens]NLJ19384.1 hypothetical protein [Globicatella sulfidifaciens]
MLVRLIGKDKVVVASTWSTPFNDVPKWAEPLIGYAYEYGLTKSSVTLIE